MSKSRPLPNRLRELRLDAKLSQQALADRIGTSKVTISSLELGKMMLSLEYMKRIAVAIGVPAIELLKREQQDELVGADEMKLVRAFRAAGNVQKELILRIAAPLRFSFEADPMSAGELIK